MANGNDILLRGEFTVSPIKQGFSLSLRQSNQSAKCAVTLTETTLAYIPENQKPGAGEIQVENVVGCEVYKEEEASFIVYHYPYKAGWLSRKEVRQREKVTFVVRGETDQSEALRTAERWCRFISRLLQGETAATVADLPDGSRKDQQRLLVLINPFGGSGRGRALFDEKAAPLLTEAGFLLDIIVTDRGGHGYDIARKLPIGKYNGIVVVSGDGLFNEVGHGLIHHADAEEALKIPIGILPGGSSNAHCCSLLHSAGDSFRQDPFMNAAFLLARYQPHPMDVIAVDTCRGRRMYCWLAFAWGLISDIDIESERYRRLGSTIRFNIGIVTRLLLLRRYKGRLHYKPVDSDPKENLTNDSTISGNNVESSSNMSNGLDVVTGSDSQSSSTLETVNESNISSSIQTKNAISDTEVDISLSDEPKTCTPKEIPTSHLVDINKPVPSDWLTVEEEVIYVVVVNHKFLDPDVLTVPEAEIDDGVMYLQYMRATPECTRHHCMDTMFAMKDSSHLKQDEIVNIKVKAFRIEPLTDGAIMTVDGESVPYGPIQGEVVPSVCNVMAGYKHKWRSY